MLRYLLLETLILKQLNKQLDLGHHQWVYRFSSFWGGRLFLSPFYGPSWKIQTRLIKEFGYRECLYCHWSLKRQEEHSYCSKQINLRPEND